MSRNDEPNEIVAVGGNAPPDWLAEYTEQDTSLDAMAEYKVLSRIKVIQGMTNQEMKESFGEGSAIVIPTNELLVKKGDSFLFVPTFFFPEFTKRSDLKDKTSDFIMERTFDPESSIAKKSRNADTRVESYGQDDMFEMKYVESLCFPGFIYGDHQLASRLMVLAFERGEYTQGTTFVSAISLRKSPLWSQVWEFTPRLRSNAPNPWWGLDFRNPEPNFITQEEAPAYLAFHEELKDDFAKKRLVVDHGDSSDGEREVTVDVTTVPM